MTVLVITKDGKRTVPTANIRKVRLLLRKGKAKIVRYRPFTIQMLKDSDTKNRE